jgi:hypothetical protein
MKDMSEYRHPFQDIYDKLPKVACQGHCGKDRNNTCCGPIPCTAAEAKLLDECDGVKSEWQDCGNGMVHQKVAENPEVLGPFLINVRLCPHLGLNGRCTAYEARPLVCRLFGVSRRLPCPWGCQPERWMTDREERGAWAAVTERSRKLNVPQNAVG